MITKETIGIITDIEAMKQLYKKLELHNTISSKLKMRTINKKLDVMFENIYEIGISYELLSALSILLRNTSYSFKITNKSESVIIIDENNKCRFLEEGVLVDYYDITILFNMIDYDILESYKISFRKEKAINISHKISKGDNIISEYIVHINDNILIDETYDIGKDGIFIILYTIANAIISYIKDTSTKEKEE